MKPIVPSRFIVPEPLGTEEFRLEPLEPRHNDRDLPAWTSSIQHIRATAGFSGRGWPGEPLSAEENARDLRRHALHRQERSGFTYAVLSGDDYVGCVYFYPPRDDTHDVDVRSWVTSRHAELDKPLYDAVSAWLEQCWPWTAPEYAPR